MVYARDNALRALAPSKSTKTATKSPNPVFWYNVDKNSFGFSPSKSISLDG